MERRSIPRHRIVAPVLFPNGTGVTRDLSTNSLFFFTNDGRFELGQLREFSVTLSYADPAEPTELVCRGRVCRIEQDVGDPGAERRVGVAICDAEFAFAGNQRNQCAVSNGAAQ